MYRRLPLHTAVTPPPTPRSPSHVSHFRLSFQLFHLQHVCFWHVNCFIFITFACILSIVPASPPIPFSIHSAFQFHCASALHPGINFRRDNRIINLITTTTIITTIITTITDIIPSVNRHTPPPPMLQVPMIADTLTCRSSVLERFCSGDDLSPDFAVEGDEGSFKQRSTCVMHVTRHALHHMHPPLPPDSSPTASCLSPSPSSTATAPASLQQQQQPSSRRCVLLLQCCSRLTRF